jgi:signal peptide peptidase SppA
VSTSAKKSDSNTPVVIDLSATGITDYGIITEAGYRALLASRLERSLISAESLEQRLQAAISVDSQGDGARLQYGYMLDIVGHVAIVNINGVLVNNDDPYNRFFGEVGYPEIQGALAEAISQPGVKSILLNMNTPGGAVSGISDMADTLKAVAQHFPMHAHASSSACSGGYWLSCAADSISASSLAEIGSIGVIAVMRSYYEYYKSMGIENVVLRQGEFKALGNPYEPITEAAKKATLDQMGVVYDTFLNLVSESRNIPVQKLKDTAAEGRVFFGQDAIKVGLIDKISSFDQVLAEMLQANQSSDPSTGNMSMKKGTLSKILSAAAQAAIAAGMPIEVALVDKNLQPTPEEIAAHEAKVAAEAAAGGGEGDGESDGDGNDAGGDDEAAAKAAADAAAAEAAATEAAAAGASASAGLASVVADLSMKVAKAETLLAARDAEIIDLKASVAVLKPIVIEAANNKQIALGGHATPMDSLSPAVIAEQYGQLKAEFLKNLPVGGVARGVVDDNDGSDQNSGANVTTLRASAKNLTSFNRKK